MRALTHRLAKLEAHLGPAELVEHRLSAEGATILVDVLAGLDPRLRDQIIADARGRTFRARAGLSDGAAAALAKIRGELGERRLGYT